MAENSPSHGDPRVINRMPEQVLEDQQGENTQVESDSALRQLVTLIVRCQTELYKAYTEDGGVPGVAERGDVPGYVPRREGLKIGFSTMSN